MGGINLDVQAWPWRAPTLPWSVSTLWLVLTANLLASELMWAYVIRRYPKLGAARYSGAGSLGAAAAREIYPPVSDRLPQLAKTSDIPHLSAMTVDQSYPRDTPRRGPSRGPIIDQEGRKIRPESMRPDLGGFRFDFATSGANPFGNLTREQRLARVGCVGGVGGVGVVLCRS